MRGGSLVLGVLFGVAFCAGASCAKPATTVGVTPKMAAAISGDVPAMTCTLEQIDQTDENVALVCTVPRDLSDQIRSILQGRQDAGAGP